MARWDIYSVWFGMVIMVVVALLFELILAAEFSDPLYWFRMIMMTFIAALSIMVFMQRRDAAKRHDRQVKKLEKVYASHVRRKNLQIQELKKRNEFLIRTALKQAERAKSISDQAKMLIEGKKRD